jgi:hypothetical protein
MGTDIQETLIERGARYGCYRGQSAISQRIKDVYRDTPNWELLSDDQRETLEMIAHKAARILNGDPNCVDSWRDMAGYAMLITNRLDGRPYG